MVHTMCEFENQRCVDPMKPSGKQLIKNRFELIQFPTFFLKTRLFKQFRCSTYGGDFLECEECFVIDLRREYPLQLGP